MTEKADLPSETVSLPPTYAPSESFTESPPPAYRKPGMAAVRVARIVCCTLLAMTFMVGFFVVMHKWVQNRECNCAMEEVESVRHAALFAQSPNKIDPNLNNNKIEEAISEAEPDSVLLDEESIEREDDLTPEEQLIDDESSTEDEEKDVDLPKDLLLGNPKLAGRNVHCKVQKRQRKIAEGIMSQAIIVTCDDDDGEDEVSSNEVNEDRPMLNIVPMKPPMSLLSNIMKILSSRPRSMDREQDEPPRMIPFPLRSPPPPPHGPMPMRGPFPGPFQGPVSPIFVPLRKIEMRRPSESEEVNAPLPFLRGPPPPPFMSEERPPPHMQHRHIPPPPPMRFMERPDETNERRGPFPFSSGPVPIRIIRLPPRENEVNEQENFMQQEEENEGPMPLPVHPLIKLLPRRRIIRLRPKESLDNVQSLENALPFPFPRGALPPRFVHEEEQVPHPMPEATGRALPAPVALPGVRVLRLPFRPQPMPFPDANLITHMEMKAPSEEEQPQELQQGRFLPPSLPENSFRQNNKEFGPPRTHTVLENLPMPVFHMEEQQEEDSPSLDTIHHEPITQTQSQPRILAPPPPSFAREGRTSILAQLNPDAEVIPTIEETDRPRPAMHQVVLN